MRYLTESISKDISRKAILLSGPRQTGKTTFSRTLSKSAVYLNYDIPEDRLMIHEQSWDRSKELLILDELHKMSGWKLFLKSLTDSDRHKMKIIVTGSARLDITRKVGDSLAGRYFQYRLYPLDVKEAVEYFDVTEQDAFNRLITVSGFPEPFLLNNPGEYQRWRRTHTDIILRQDLIQLETVEEIVKIETLVELLRSRVGSSIAYSNLALDLDVAPKTVQRWLKILENLFVVFPVIPYSKKLTRAIKKAPKYYFYDCAAVKGDMGAKFENMVALSLKKEIDFRADVAGEVMNLHYARNKQGQEIDFIVLKDEKPFTGIECKWSDLAPHKAFQSIGAELGLKKYIQLVAECEREKTYSSGLEIRKASSWLSNIRL